MKPLTNCEELIKAVLVWADERGLIERKFNDKQLIKINEEVGELNAAHLKDSPTDIIDALGDILVTLIIYANQRSIPIYDALFFAYQEIKDRKGKLINGTFIKSEG